MQGCGLAATFQPVALCSTTGHAQAGRNSAVDVPSCSACGASRLLSSSVGVGTASSRRRNAFFARGVHSLKASSREENGRGVSGGRRMMPRAAIAVDAPVEMLAGEYQLDGGAGYLKIKTSGAAPGSPAFVDFEVTSSNVSSLVLHWGAIKAGTGKWYRPSHQPADSWDFQGQAVQSRFVKEGDRAFLRVELEDNAFNAIEFLLKEDNTDRWFKNSGGNFRVEIPSLDITIPEDLIAIQAYIRWERDGQQTYSPEQEKENVEAARKDLQLELASGLSIDALRTKLLQGGDHSGNGSTPSESKAAKPKKKTFNLAKGTRKQRDPLELLNQADEVSTGVAQGGATAPPREPTPLEAAAKTIEEEEEGFVILRKIMKLGPSDLLVLVSNPDGQLRVRLATNLQQGPLTLHWAVSKDNAREWLAPAEKVLPEGSVLTEGFAETPFNDGFAGDASLKSLEISLGDTGYIGMPFLFKVGEEWWKDNGGDYYVSLRAADKKIMKAIGDGIGTAKAFLEDIAGQESEAERSLMHRYNIATGLTQRAKDEGELALVGILVWLRYMATRQLTWNKNYNVKPREISAAQEKVTDLLQAIYRDQPQNREVVRLIMSTVGRGGQGDVGQRIRDEILVVQRNNDAKGGMMEEWHQKLHNNTSPDDVVICQALLDFIAADFNMDVYWKSLNDNGVTKERMRSYDRPIVSEPKLRREEKDSLTRDLTHYLRTLKAVHSGADLESAIALAMGYSAEGQGFMGGVKINPISGLSGELPDLLRFVLSRVEDKGDIVPLLEGLLEARRELRQNLIQGNDRLRDIIFLDLALDSTVRTAVERGLETLNEAGPKELSYIISMVVENLALSSNTNEELVYTLKDWYGVMNLIDSKADQWALRTKAVLDRTRLALQEKAEHYQHLLQPSAEYLGALLGVEQWAIDIFTEEMIRGGSAASLSLLLNRLDPVIRKEAHMGSWQVISPVDSQGEVVVVDELLSVEEKVYEKPTILVAGRVRGEEEIPDGAVAVLTPDMPDILSHVSVRARNGKILFATCFDSGVLDDLRKLNGKAIKVQVTGTDLKYSEIAESELSGPGTEAADVAPPPTITLKKKTFAGKYAVAADEFNPDLVGAKSRNIAYLRGKLPEWIKLPTSVALPFGVFEKVLAEPMNKDVATDLAALEKDLAAGDFQKLKDARETCLRLQAPPALVEELKTILKGSDMPWPGDESEERWEQAWIAIKKVWGSKWNERAYFSTRKVKIDHHDLCMSVLVQEIIRADYAFVIHTTNPSTDDSSEIYAEVVKGLGETLVGAYSGRALSFISKKSDLNTPIIQGFPSKRIGLFIKQSIIFRSDSNGEDLEGYAGAGLYDSVPMDSEDEKVVDYSSDPLLLDLDFQKSVLTKIAKAGAAIEELYGSPQDIEGVIKDGELYVVQTRPQM
ncbi:unnamed protein product [Calypogeia fissa]